MSAYKDAAERVADDILGMSASALERRDQLGRRRAVGTSNENGNRDGDGSGEVGMKDVLRGLSRVIDR